MVSHFFLMSSSRDFLIALTMVQDFVNIWRIRCMPIKRCLLSTFIWTDTTDDNDGGNLCSVDTGRIQNNRCFATMLCGRREVEQKVDRVGADQLEVHDEIYMRMRALAKSIFQRTAQP
mmetsp:Transcript_7121/g.16188  ORF Transcript_7121/g.16188 Transcript_7121/m.16188 type:complete len:118 (-) Transcript_7121:39-392(-)